MNEQELTVLRLFTATQPRGATPAPASPLLGKAILLCAALLFCLGAWAWFGHIEVVATATGRVIPDGRVKVIQPVETAVVRTIAVREGQQVQAGAPLIELDATYSAADLDRITQKHWQVTLELVRLEAMLASTTPSYPRNAPHEQVQLQEQLRLAQESSYRAKQANATATLAGQGAALAAAQAALQKQALQAPLIKERQGTTEQLVAAGFISRQGALAGQQELIGAQGDLAVQQQVVQQRQHVEQDARNQLQALQHSRRAELLQEIAQKKELLATTTAELDKARQTAAFKTLRAPVAGTVQTLAVNTLGAVVTPAQVLLTIVPHDTPLLLEVQIGNQDIGFVRQGQPVEVRLDAFPFNKYGSARGELVWVSADAELANGGNGNNNASAPNSTNPDLAPRQPGAQYRAHVRVTQDSPHAPLLAQLRPGMSAQALIHIDTRRIYEFFWSPMRQSIQDAAQTR